MTVQTMDPVPTNTLAAPAEQQPPATTEQSAQTTEQEQQQGQTEGEKPEGAEQQPADKTEQPKKGGVQKRIDELTRKAHEAEREAAFWREQAAKSQAPSQDAATKPARDAFASDADYFEALADWKAEQKVSEFRKQQQAEALNKAEQTQTATRFELYQERVSTALDAMPDYHEVVGGSDVPAEAHVLEAILDSEQGPQLAYHLAKHPDVAQRLNDMAPVQAAREIGRLEAQLVQPKTETPPPKRTTNAPPPINPVRGSNGQFTKSPDQMTDAEWYASQRK
nr:MAG TPA: scaffold Bacteriophage, scaffolding protein [Caudoviricetes sp.]